MDRPSRRRSLKTKGRSSVETSTAVPYRWPGLWERVTTTKIDDSPSGPVVLEIDVILADPELWAKSAERREDNWDEHVTPSGSVFAERTLIAGS